MLQDEDESLIRSYVVSLFLLFNKIQKFDTKKFWFERKRLNHRKCRLRKLKFIGHPDFDISKMQT